MSNKKQFKSSVVRDSDFNKCIVPDGDITGWKKCIYDQETNDWGELLEYKTCLVQLLIPKRALRSNAFDRKCRASYAKVVKVYNKSGLAYSWYAADNQSRFQYKAGKTVRPRGKFSKEWMEECESGVHFFISRAEAEDYDF